MRVWGEGVGEGDVQGHRMQSYNWCYEDTCT